MKIKVLTVHPTVTRVDADGTTTEIPTHWFSSRPTPGQVWDLKLERQLSDADRIAELNRYIGTA